MIEDNRIPLSEKINRHDKMLVRGALSYQSVRNVLIEDPSMESTRWANTVAHITDMRFGGLPGYLEDVVSIHEDLREVRTLEVYTHLIVSSIRVMTDSSYQEDFPVRKRKEIAGFALAHAAYVGMLEGNGFLEGMPIWDSQITQLRSQEMQPILASLYVQDSWDLTAELLSQTFSGLYDLDPQTAPYIGSWVFADVLSEQLRSSSCTDDAETFIYSIGVIDPLHIPEEFSQIVQDGFAIFGERLQMILRAPDPYLSVNESHRLTVALNAAQFRTGIASG